MKSQITILARRGWWLGVTILMGCLAMMFLAVSPAFTAPITATLYTSQVTAPAGTVWIPGNLGGHLWLSDNILGFCRLDPAAGGATATINPTTCNNLSKGSAGQASYDPVNKFVYVPDSSSKSLGIYRLGFDPATETINAASLIGGAAGLGANRPGSAILGPDGKVYVSFLKTGTLVRITAPTAISQTVETIGGSSDGKKISSLTFVGNNLYLAESTNVKVITNVTTSCVANSNCQGAPSAVNVIAPIALTYDGINTIYAADASTVQRYNLTTKVQDIFATSGVISGTNVVFQGISGLGLDKNANLYVGDDPNLGLKPLLGHLWKVSSTPPPTATPIPSTATATLKPSATPITPTATATIKLTATLTATATPIPPSPTASSTPLATPTTVPGPIASASLYDSGVSAPGGLIWLPGALGGHLWISDHIFGFCRLDPAVGGATATINATICDTLGNGSPGQASFDPANNVVFVPDGSSKSQGVWRFQFDPATETINTPSLVGAGLIQAINRPMATVFGPDSKLYVSFKVNGSIVRLTTPSGLTQTLEPVGASSDNRIVVSLGFIGSDLYMAETTKLSRIANATTCAGGCLGATTIFSVLAPTDFAYDGTTYLYVADIGSVTRFNFATGAKVIYATSGTMNGVNTPFQGVSALGFDSKGKLLVADDSSLGRLVGQGHLWLTTVGAPPPPPPAPLVTGTLLSSNLTAPSGQVWLPGALGGHLWVADHLQGFCRLDPDATGKTVSINSTTCNDLNKGAVGQPSFDPFTNFVYVPDLSSKSLGVWRLKFNPASETVDAGLVISATTGLGASRPEVSTIGPDGKLYIGFKQSGNIVRVVGADTATPMLEQVGLTSDNRLALSLGFIGNDLYIAESTKLTLITGAAGCFGGCLGSPAGITVVAPTDFAYDGVKFVYISDMTSVYRYDLTTLTQVLFANSGNANGVFTPFLGISSLGFDQNGNLLVGDDPTLGIQAIQGHLWTMPAGAAPPPPPPPAPTPTPSPTTTPVAQAITQPLTASLFTSNLTLPAGTIWLTGTLGGHLWVSDNVRGFCRLDLATGGATATINATTCNALGKGKAGQASFDPVNNFVYVPDTSAQNLGVYRLPYNRATETVGAATLLAGGQGLGNTSPFATALGPDGKLYVSFKSNGNIVRIKTPNGATQTVESVGTSSDLRRVFSLAFVGGDLYLAQTSRLTRFTNAASCTGACVASATGITVILPSALVSDGGAFLFVGNVSRVVRYNVTTAVVEIYSNGSTLNGNTTAYQGVTGLGLDPKGNLYVGDDPGLGFTTGSGHLWKIAVK